MRDNGHIDIFYYDPEPHRHKRNNFLRSIDLDGIEIKVSDPGNHTGAISLAERCFPLYIMHGFIEPERIRDLVETIGLTLSMDGYTVKNTPSVYVIGASQERINELRRSFSDLQLNPDKVCALPCAGNGYMQPLQMEEAERILANTLVQPNL